MAARVLSSAGMVPAGPRVAGTHDMLILSCRAQVMRFYRKLAFGFVVCLFTGLVVHLFAHLCVHSFVWHAHHGHSWIPDLAARAFAAMELQRKQEPATLFLMSIARTKWLHMCLYVSNWSKQSHNNTRIAVHYFMSMAFCSSQCFVTPS